MTDRAALLDCADEVLDGEVALGARGPRTAAVLARLAFEDWLNVTGQVVSGSQGRPSASMTSVSKRVRPCLAAVDR
jgi:hypothetical protein